MIYDLLAVVLFGIAIGASLVCLGIWLGQKLTFRAQGQRDIDITQETTE